MNTKRTTNANGLAAALVDWILRMSRLAYGLLLIMSRVPLEFARLF